MKENIKTLGLFIVRFGFAKGLSMFYHFINGHFSRFKIPTLKQPVWMRQNTSDSTVFKQVFLKNEYNIKLPFKPRIIVDGGANIGLFSLKMKNEFPESKIISIEPDPENFKSVLKNFEGYDNLFAENCGLWNKPAQLKVYDKFHSGKWGMVTEEDPNGNIRAVSIDSLMQQYDLPYIDILKLDIESSEKLVFSGNYMTWLPKVKMIIIELHDNMLPGCSKTFFEAINTCFKSYSYSISGENTVIINEDLGQTSFFRRPSEEQATIHHS